MSHPLDDEGELPRETQNAPTTAPADPISLPSGHELDEDTVVAVCAAKLARLVVLAGPAESGKTTLLATIYQRFQQKPFADFRFAGSRSLLAFERVSHDSRLESRRREPETSRTPYTANRRYLHLALGETHSAGVHNLLVTDLAGEHFRRAAKSEEECKKLVLSTRADHFAVLVDGKRLVNPETRTSTGQEARRLVRSFLDASMIGRQTIVEMLFTKWDVVSHDADTVAYANSLAKECERIFASAVSKIVSMRIAARSGNPEIQSGLGVDELLKQWVRESSMLSLATSPERPIPLNRSPFDSFVRSAAESTT